MPQDIMGRELTKYGGSYSVDQSLLTFPNLPGDAAYVPYIVLNLGLQYGQQISRFYGFNSNRVFLVAGRSQGSGTMSQILAPQGSFQTFHRVYGNVCNAKGNLLQFQLAIGCTDETRSVNRFQCGMTVVNSTSINGESESAVVNNSINMSFESFEYMNS